jgi:surface protein
LPRNANALSSKFVIVSQLEVVQADLVQVSQHPDNNETVELDHKRQRWNLYGIASCVLLLLIGIIVGVIANTRTNSSNLPIVQSTTTATINPTRSNAPSMAPSLILPSGKHAFTTTAQLYDAVDAFEASVKANDTAGNSEVAEMYGFPMGTWDVSRLSDFSRVFNRDLTETLDPNAPISGLVTFDEDLSGWNVSNAVNMHGMFAGANQFVGKGLEKWDVGRVSDFSKMFMNANDFVGSVSLWDTSSATTMEAMFANARKLNGDLSLWDVSRVRTMAYMFFFCPKVSRGRSHAVERGPRRKHGLHVQDGLRIQWQCDDLGHAQLVRHGINGSCAKSGVLGYQCCGTSHIVSCSWCYR